MNFSILENTILIRQCCGIEMELLDMENWSTTKTNLSLHKIG